MTRIPGTTRAIAGGDAEATRSTWKPALMLTNRPAPVPNPRKNS
jgi:hypothetical protein